MPALSQLATRSRVPCQARKEQAPSARHAVLLALYPLHCPRDVPFPLHLLASPPLPCTVMGSQTSCCIAPLLPALPVPCPPPPPLTCPSFSPALPAPRAPPIPIPPPPFSPALPALRAPPPHGPGAQPQLPRIEPTYSHNIPE